MRVRPQIRAMMAAFLYSAALAVSAIAVGATQQATIELSLPRPAAAGEAVWLRIRAGALPRGAEILISTTDGVLLGTVSPFGVRSGQEPTYTIALPKTAIVDGRVQLRLEIDEGGAPARPPRPGEVESVTLIYVPVTN